MKFFLLILIVCSPAFAARKSLDLTGLKAHELCSRLGNYSGFGTQDGAFGIICQGDQETAQASIIFDSDRNQVLTKVSFKNGKATAILTDKKEAYDMLNSVGRSYGGPGYYITCKTLDEYSQFADSCTVNALAK